MDHDNGDFVGLGFASLERDIEDEERRGDLPMGWRKWLVGRSKFQILIGHNVGTEL